MNSITELESTIRDLNVYPNWGGNVDAADTKASSKNNEEWVRECFDKNFPDLKVFRTGSQTDPDFYLLTKVNYAIILKRLGVLYDKRKTVREKPTQKEFLKTVSQLGLLGLMILFIELSVKGTTGKVYRTNRHPPLYGSKKIFINFSNPDKRVYVAIANDIACRSAKTKEAHEIPIVVEQKRREFVLWARQQYKDGLYGQTYMDAQPNRSADAKIMNVDSTFEDLDKLFNEVRFPCSVSS